MSILDIAQWFINIACILGVSVCFIRLNRRPKDDPRLSKGLQLLQSKISVLEDLSDRTEGQVSQMTKLLEAKTGQVQNKIQQAESQIRKIEVAMEKSKEVAELFQDKIPHDEIVERKNTIKYVQAARMAHSGASIDEITKSLGLPKAEVEFIAKVNKDQLMFDEARLPEWAKVPVKEGGRAGSATPTIATDIELVTEEEDSWEVANTSEVSSSDEEYFVETDKEQFDEIVPELMSPAQRAAAAAADFSRAFGVPSDDYESLKEIGAQFRDACKEYEKTIEEEVGEIQSSHEPSMLVQAATNMTQKIVQSAGDFLNPSDQRQSHTNEVERQKTSTNKNGPSDVKVLPSDYARNQLGSFFSKDKRVKQEDVLKVKFPSVDFRDDLG